MKTEKLNVAETRLERHAQKWINEKAQKWINEKAQEYPETGVEGVLKDLFYGGCQSGTVGHLIYYRDTVKFFATHRREISAMLKESLSESGVGGPGELFGDKWDADDPLAQEDLNRNLLAWFGFEEAARRVASRAGIET